MTGRWTRSALSLGAIALIAAALAGTAAAKVEAGGGAAAKTVNVGFIYPKTGGLAQFGSEEYDGFLAGLAYTKGQCGGYTINPTFVDDATDPATAIAAFKSLVGQGTKIIAGTGSSGIALQLGDKFLPGPRQLNTRSVMQDVAIVGSLPIAAFDPNLAIEFLHFRHGCAQTLKTLLRQRRGNADPGIGLPRPKNFRGKGLDMSRVEIGQTKPPKAGT